MACGFRALNVSFEEREDGMLVHGGRPTGGQVDGFGDHRISVAFSVMGLRTHGEVDVMGSRCSAVSYPNFTRIWLAFVEPSRVRTAINTAVGRHRKDTQHGTHFSTVDRCR